MVTLELDGKYHVVFYGQDTERASFDTKAAAFEWYKDQYRFANGFMRSCEPVDDPVFFDKTKWPLICVHINKVGRFEFSLRDDSLRQALDIAVSKARFKDGHRYEIQIKLKEVKETPTFIAEGI